MASAIGDMTNCQVCYEEFNQEGHLPRLLPCSHTTCHSCLEHLVRQKPQKISCPQCRSSHRVGQEGVKSFAQNKYILHHINSNKTSERCDEHRKELVLYCKDPCREAICPKCYTLVHKTHDVIDLDSQKEENVRNLNNRADTVISLIESGINELEKVRKQTYEDGTTELSIIEDERIGLERYIKGLTTVLNIVNHSEANVIKIRQSNDNIVKCKIDYLKQELQRTKDYKIEINVMTNLSCGHEAIENIERHLASMCTHEFQLQKMRYEKTLDLNELADIPAFPLDSVLKTGHRCRIMEGCLDKLESNKRKRKQVLHDVPIPKKKRRTSSGPDAGSQREAIDPLLKKELQEGSTMYLLEKGWFNKWKKYVGFDNKKAGWNPDLSCDPGPIDNASLFFEGTGKPKPRLHFISVPVAEEVWVKLCEWYGCKEGSAITRKVYNDGALVQVKDLKIEFSLWSLKLYCYPDLGQHIVREFSRLDTVHMLEREMRALFGIPDDRAVRLWRKYTPTNRILGTTIKLLEKPDDPIFSADVYHNDNIIVEVKNEDGSWSCSSKKLACIKG